ncbi:MAG: hypothetical protein K8S27_14440 [Candidatus Omnitrophica bacterium]|nr:hypothetical protein [Candidatus Omnitrophota bacterium]
MNEHLRELKSLHDTIFARIQIIPKNGRVLITAQDAFIYFEKVLGHGGQGAHGQQDTNRRGDQGTPERTYIGMIKPKPG